MSTELAKRPGTVMRTYTQQVRDHTSAMARAQDQYFAALKRAEAQYFETVKRITEALTQETEPVADAASSPDVSPPIPPMPQ
jgi:hypothetical protein